MATTLSIRAKQNTRRVMIQPYKFETRGVGLITDRLISKGAFVGNYVLRNVPTSPLQRHIYDGWVETDPFGRYLNHNDNSNLEFVLNNEAVEVFAREDIEPYTELTVNYFDLVNLLNVPKSIVEEFSIKKFSYEEELIKINKDLL